jgi:hypothetical protein
MADDRELIVLSKSKSLEAIAYQLGRTPKFILGKAARLGLKIKCEKAKLNE